MEDELEKFRNDWKIEVDARELKNNIENKSAAVDCFLEATKLEQAKDFMGAMQAYRKAYKLDPEVEFKYKELFDFQSFPVSIEEQVLAEKFDRIVIKPKIRNATNKECYFNQLPVEIIIRIINFTICPMIEILSTIRLLNKLFNDICKNESIWRYLCISFHDHTPVRDLESQILNYGGNWQNLFLMKPRVRQDGIYISKVLYKRTGWSETLTYVQPVHIVTYYRYLRLMKNNIFIFLTTSEEPKAYIPYFINNRIKGAITGVWKFDKSASDIIIMEWNHPKQRNICICATFRICATIKGNFNKLKWGIFRFT